MKKGMPHCKLHRVKELVVADQVRITISAASDAQQLGFDRLAMLNVLRRLTMKDFFKSMTTHENHQIWQDVYRPRVAEVSLYVKLTVIDVLIVSFKEL